MILKDEIIKIIEFKNSTQIESLSNVKIEYNSRRISESFFKKNHEKLYNLIILNYSHLKSFSQMIYHIIYDLDDIKQCKSCNKEVRFRKFSEGYSTYCSVKCIGLDKSVKEKRIQTNIKKYGFQYSLQNKKIKEKTKQTNLERYGVEHPAQNKKIKEKTKQTNLEKYGVEHHLKLDSQKQKQKETNLEKYGVDNPQKNKKIKEKTKQTNLERYGVEHPAQNELVKEKTVKTITSKYGVSSTFQSNIIKEKTKQTNLERYGVEYPAQNKLIREKIVISNNKAKIKHIDYWKNILNVNDIIINTDDDYIIGDYCKKHIFTINRFLLKNRIRCGIKNICTICNPLSENTSIKENELKDFLEKELNLTIFENDRLILNGKELDIYLPDNNLAIEFDGLYYHSEQFKSNTYHVNKTNECESKGIKLLHIFEDEWTYKSNIVKSIIKSKLGLNYEKIFARKCEIREISSSESKYFLEKNHVQGNINSSIRLGLYYSDDLISLMTFGKKRKSMGGESEEGQYEMYRFCNKLNTSVIGGASKLFNYFLKTYNPKEVISYADRRYFDGSIYKKLGFNLIGITKPNYWYFKKSTIIRKHRFGFRKDVLVKEGFDKNKTEREIMNERGYYRIYDCGNLKYSWNE